MELSDAGLRFIAGWEGCRLRPYNDGAGWVTVGYGHVLHAGTLTLRDKLTVWTPGKALATLRKDCATAQRAVQQLVTRPLGQGQFDALVSFAFNCGGGALAHSTLLKDVNAHLGSKGAASIRADFLRWNHAGGAVMDGLTRRRRAEASLYLQGDYGDV